MSGYVERLERENKRLRAKVRELQAASLGVMYEPVNEHEAWYRAQHRGEVGE